MPRASPGVNAGQAGATALGALPLLDVLLVSPVDPETLRRALRSAADALLFDLDDAAVPGDRAARRRATLDVLTGLRDPRPLARGGEEDRPRAARPAAIVRVAPLSSGLAGADLDAVLPGAPDAVLLPGAVGGVDLQRLAAKLAVAEAEHGLAAGRTGILAAPADTAAGVLALGTLPGATPRLRALLWDPPTLALALGTGPDAAPVSTARGLLLLAASACGVPAIDGSTGGGEAGRRDGFAGRLVCLP